MHHPTPRLERLACAAFTYPIVDNHAHNLLNETHCSSFPFEGLTSEASGKALDDAVHSVALYKATAQLAHLYDCEPTFEAVKTARDAMSYEKLCELCFKSTGIVSLLLDDGLDKIDELCYDFKWHDRLTSTPSKRIVRIEVVAQNLVKQLQARGKSDLNSFTQEFEDLIIESCKDSQVVAFKSVACYRTGLNIEKHEDKEVADQYCIVLSDLKKSGSLRLAHKAFNDHMVRIVLKIAGKFGTPVQFHTGLADNDIRLVSATPAVMQPVITEFPDTKFVLLHASYPFTQEAGYLASVYKNVYLDFGEVFPMVSAEGQRTIVRQVLELAPTNKILWSTDGHWWPETYYLAVLQARNTLYEVLSDSVTRGDMSEPQAVGIVERMLFHNANSLYNLGLTPTHTGLVIPPHSSDAVLPLGGPPTLASLAARGIRYVRIHLVDYCGIVRYRVVPIARLQRMVANSERPGVNLTKVCFGMVRLATPSTLGSLGEYFFKADLSTLRACTYAEGHASVMSFLEEKEVVERPDGLRTLEVDMDPRTNLKRIVRSAKDQDGLNFLVGFEIEFILLKPEGKFPTPVNDHEYSVSAALPSGSPEAKTLDEIAEALESCGIVLEQYHAEGADGQYEIVTGPLPPLESVDALITTREIIFHIAAKNGLHATFTPRLFKHTCGSALHTHLSVTSSSVRASTPAKNAPISEVEASFLQSMLDHLPALCAFTLSSPASYARVVDGIWSGGTWVAWGRDNREVPIRLCGSASQGWNFEVKTLDSTANPYLAIAALLYAGILGIRRNLPLRMRDCQFLAAKLSAEERAALGITNRLSLNLEEAIGNLDKDTELKSVFGDKLIKTYVSVIELRRDIVSKMSEEAQREWMAKYY